MCVCVRAWWVFEMHGAEFITNLILGVGVRNV